MKKEDTQVRTALRIPGNWANPGELVARLPAGVRLTPETLVLPDGTEVEFIPMPPDDQFPQIFRTSCRQPAEDDELAILDSYTVNVGLAGPGGSMEAALAMLQAGAAIVRAGGAGVFLDNSGVAHGGRKWIEIAEDSGPDAVSFAYVGIVRGRQEVWTMGMNVLGLPDLVMHPDSAPDALIEVVRYLASGEKPMGDGHLVLDENGPRFQVMATGGDRFDAESPMHNPFGRLKLVSIKEIGENN